jgi:putative ATPase
MSLFEQSEAANLRRAQPLAARMRPRTLGEFAGQQHFLGEGKLLWRLLKAQRLESVIFYGPPGTGKTTLARLLAVETDSRFRQLSAVTSGVKDLREVLSDARDEISAGGPRTLLFIDEIHRFNKGDVKGSETNGIKLAVTHCDGMVKRCCGSFAGNRTA